MPVKKAAAKALRQDQKKAIKNARERLKIQGLIRRSRRAITEKKSEAQELVKQTTKALDKAVAHRVMKKNTVGRLKSRLTKKRG